MSLSTTCSLNEIKNLDKLDINDFVKQHNIRKTSLSYEDYISKNVILKKYKIPDLKSIAKQHKIHITGTKVVLIKRIETHFLHIKNSIIIQRYFRGHMARLFIKLRGPAVNNRSICVNETDGYTLEPLKEIDFEKFYSYTDKKNFIYGFDIFSLLQIYKKNGKILNPYTRERFDNRIINEVVCLGKIIHIIQPHLFEDEPAQPIQNSIVANTHNFNGQQIELLNKLQEIRSRSIQTRINDLFIEIDLLGNYTQSVWFSQLEKREYIRFFRLLHNLWNFRGQLSNETKKRICQIYDPFLNIRLPNNLFDLSLEQIKKACVTIIEDMVYCGIDTEYRKIGALHVLSILTVVSVPARNNMMWLYESLLY